MGAVVEITTRMPQAFEAGVKLTGASQSFKQYATSDEYGTWQVNAYLAGRSNGLSYWLSAIISTVTRSRWALRLSVRPANPSGADAGFRRLR